MYDYSEEITNYLFKQMSPLQREAFEKKLELDPELAAEVARQKQMLETAQALTNIKEAQEDPQYEEVDKLTSELLESRDTQIHSHKSRNRGEKVLRFVFRRIAAAAAVAALLFVDIFTPLPAEKLRRRTQERYGFRAGLTENFGKKIGRVIAKTRARFRKQ